ncbi:MAG: right-handed parallel beta-helix repeat-containing protein [Myxococcota bacterium]
MAWWVGCAGPSDGGPDASDDGSSADADADTDADADSDSDADTDTDADSDADTDADADPTALCPELPPVDTDCTKAEVVCVGSEVDTLAAAARQVGPGSTVVVAPGRYDGVEIDVSGTEAAPIVWYADGAVELDQPGPTGDGIRLTDASWVTIRGFTITDPPERCIAARDARPTDPMVGLVIAEVTCERSGVEGFYLSEVSDSVIRRNTITTTGTSGSSRSHGIYLANAGSDGTTLDCNTISGATTAESNGIHFNGDASVGGDGVISGLTVAGNVVFGNLQNGFNLDGVQDSLFIGNLVYDNGQHALRAYRIDGAQGPRGLVVIANTLIGDAAFKTSEDGGDHVVFDNVLVATSGEEGAISIDSASTFQSASNLIVGRITPDDQRTFLTLAEWQDAGYDAGSVTAPVGTLFDADYTPAAGSIGIDAGIPSFAGHDAPTVDLRGTPRPTSDLGAIER